MGQVICHTRQPAPCYRALAYEQFLNRFLSNVRNVKLGVPPEVSRYRFKYGSRNINPGVPRLVLISKKDRATVMSPDAKTVFEDDRISIFILQ